MTLSNRELALLIWISIAVCLLLWKGRDYLALFRLLRAFTSRHFVILLSLMVMYVVACVFLLRSLTWWSTANLKTTFEWAVGFAFIALTQVDKISHDDTYFSTLIKEAVGMNAVLAFIASTYTFNLAVELTLAPLLLVLVFVATISENDAKHQAIHRATSNILAVVGVLVLGNSLIRISGDPSGLLNSYMAREFACPILLTLMFIPFLYSLHVYVVYERAFAFTFSGSPQSIKYARKQAIFAFKLDLIGVRKWTRHCGLFGVKTPADVDHSIAQILRLRTAEKSPRHTPPLTGWAPETAKRFLEPFGLAAPDYYPTPLGWSARSEYLKLGKTIFDNHIVYYLEGIEIAVNEISLVLAVNERYNAKSAIQTFTDLIATLVYAATPNVRNMLGELPLSDDMDPLRVEGYELRLTRQSYGEDYELTFTITAR